MIQNEGTQFTSTFQKIENWFKKSSLIIEQQIDMRKKQSQFIKKIIFERVKKYSNNFLSAQSQSQDNIINISQLIQRLIQILSNQKQIKQINLIKLFQDIEWQNVQISDKITELIKNNQNTIKNLLFQGWYPFLCKKIKSLLLSNKNILIQSLKNDFQFFIQILYDIFLYVIEKNTSVVKKKKYTMLLLDVIPQIITSFPPWKYIYTFILTNFQNKNNIRIMAQPTTQMFQINPIYNCSTAQHPYSQTLSVFQSFCQQQVINKKIKFLKYTSIKLKQQVNKHQLNLIANDLLKKPTQIIDADNILSMQQYCIYKLGNYNFDQHIKILELFYSQFVLSQVMSISFWMACLKSAYETLKYRNQNGQYNSNNYNLNTQKITGFLQKQNYCYSHCFNYISNRRLRSIQPGYISIFSQKQLCESVQILINIHNLIGNQLFVGLGCKNKLIPKNQKFFFSNKYTINYYLKTGQIYYNGQILKGLQQKNNKNIKQLRIKITKNKIQWIIPIINKSISIDCSCLFNIGQVYFLLTMSYSAQIEIFYNKLF